MKSSSCNASNQWRFKVTPYGLICVPSIAGYCIKYTAKKNYNNALAVTVERVKRDFYVDDFITSQSIKLVYFVAANNNFTFTEKQKIIRKQQQEGCEGTVRSSSQAAFLNLNLIKSTIVIISDN